MNLLQAITPISSQEGTKGSEKPAILKKANFENLKKMTRGGDGPQGGY